VLGRCNDPCAFPHLASPDIRRGLPPVARLWDAVTGKPIGEPVTHRAAVTAVAFHPGGHTFLTASIDGTAQLRVAGSRRPALPPFEHSQPIVTAASRRTATAP
jgi:WD40 repeat protein